jgi:hypothetical protein
MYIPIKTPEKKEMYYLDFVPLSTDKELRMLSSTTNLKGTLDAELVTIEVGIKLRRYAPGNIRSKLEFGYAVFLSNFCIFEPVKIVGCMLYNIDPTSTPAWRRLTKTL